jgi:hypothetical protein
VPIQPSVKAFSENRTSVWFSVALFSKAAAHLSDGEAVFG